VPTRASGAAAAAARECAAIHVRNAATQNVSGRKIRLTRLKFASCRKPTTSAAASQASSSSLPIQFASRRLGMSRMAPRTASGSVNG
jgi:hypothetical protein